MRLVTWNVQTARPNPDGPADIGRVVEHLRRLDADVVALQELDRGRARSGRVDQPAVVAEALGGTLLWGPTVRRGAGEYGVALVVVRAELVSWRVLPLGGSREPRLALLADIDHGGTRWTLAGTHLSRQARGAAAQLVRCLEALAAHPAPRVLVGDLNLEPRRVLPWSTAAGYQLLTGPATHSTRRRRPDRRIDHVLVQGATVTGAAVHRLDVSDHAAVVAELAT